MMRNLATALVGSLLVVPIVSARTPSAGDVVLRMLRVLGGADAPYQVDSIAFTFAV